MSSTNGEITDPENRMLGSAPDGVAMGRGPTPDGEFSRHDYDHPAAGWGAARSVAEVLERSGNAVEGTRAMLVMNHEQGGFDCSQRCSGSIDQGRAPPLL